MNGIAEPKTKEPGDTPGSFLQRSFMFVLRKPIHRPGYDQSRSYWTMTVRFILLRIRCTFLTFSTDLSPAVAPGPAGAGANSVLLRQSGIAVLPSSAAPPGYAAGIPTSGPRQILAGSPSRYLQGDADAPHQYRRGSDPRGCGTATR